MTSPDFRKPLLALLVCQGVWTAAAAAEAGRLKGEVEGARDHRPVVGAIIRLKETGQSVTTDKDGEYHFAAVPPGSYTLTVQLPSGLVIERAVVVASETTTKQNIAVDQALGALESVRIYSQRVPAAIARAAQQDSQNLVNLTTAEEIRKLPDVNAAEAVRRVPGISLETDTGEGRFINIRGLDADLNSTTFGGLRLPPSNNASPFGGGRAVALDAIPAGFIGGITVTKSNLPEQDAEALGGTIEITPKTAPLNSAPFAEGHLGTGREPLRGTNIVDGSITVGGRFGGGPLSSNIASYSDRPFSVVATLAYYEDKRGIDDIEAGYLDNAPATPDKAYAGFEQRLYQYHRKRHGYGIDLGYQPDADNQYYLRAFDAGYTETVNRQRLSWNFDGLARVDPANPDGLIDTISDANGGSFQKTLRDEKERIDNKVLAIGGKHVIDESVLDYRLGYTRGSYDKLYDLNSTFNYAPAAATVTYDNTSDPNYPRFAVAGATPFDPNNYTLGKIGNSVQTIRDREVSAAVNLKIATHLSRFEDESVKVGASARWRKRSTSGDSFSFTPDGNIPLSAAAPGDAVSFYGGRYNNGPSIDADFIRGLYPSSTPGNVEAAASAQSAQREDVYAAYGQYTFGAGPLSVIAGLRVEDTQAKYSGNAIGDAGISPVEKSTNYLNFFPSVQARYEIQRDLLARAAYSSTIARPGFNQVGVGASVDVGGGAVSTGNPDLKPVTAQSFDVALERYLPNGGIAALGIFDKELSNYIAARTSLVDAGTLPSSGAYTGLTGLVRVSSFVNIPNARVYGLEASYEQKLRQLAPMLDGVGVGANYTWVSSSFEIRPGESALLPSTSRNTANVYASFERFGLNARLGAYYTSRNLFGIGGSAATDIYSEGRFSVDFGSSYEFVKGLSAYFNAKNLTNTALKFTEGSSNRPIQREYYGVTLQAGLAFNY